LVRERVGRIGNAEPLKLVGEDLLCPLDLIERELVVSVGIKDAEERVRGFLEGLVVLVLAECAIPVRIGGLKHRLNGRFGDLTDRRVQLVGTQLSVLVSVGQQEKPLHARLDALA